MYFPVFHLFTPSDESIEMQKRHFTTWCSSLISAAMESAVYCARWWKWKWLGLCAQKWECLSRKAVARKCLLLVVHKSWPCREAWRRYSLTTPDLPRTLQFLLLLLFPLVDFKDCPLLELGLGVQKFHQLIAWISPPPLPSLFCVIKSSGYDCGYVFWVGLLRCEDIICTSEPQWSSAGIKASGGTQSSWTKMLSIFWAYILPPPSFLPCMLQQRQCNKEKRG